MEDCYWGWCLGEKTYAFSYVVRVHRLLLTLQNDSCFIMEIAQALLASLPISSIGWWFQMILTEISMGTC